VPRPGSPIYGDRLPLPQGGAIGRFRLAPPALLEARTSQRYPTKSALRREAEVKPAPAGDDEILTAEEAAQVLKIHPITLFVWARDGRGPPALTPPGVRLRRYSKRTLLEWLRIPNSTSCKVEDAHA